MLVLLNQSSKQAGLAGTFPSCIQRLLQALLNQRLVVLGRSFELHYLAHAFPLCNYPGLVGASPKPKRVTGSENPIKSTTHHNNQEGEATLSYSSKQDTSILIYFQSLGQSEEVSESRKKKKIFGEKGDVYPDLMITTN